MILIIFVLYCLVISLFYSSRKWGCNFQHFRTNSLQKITQFIFIFHILFLFLETYPLFNSWCIHVIIDYLFRPFFIQSLIICSDWSLLLLFILSFLLCSCTLFLIDLILHLIAPSEDPLPSLCRLTLYYRTPFRLHCTLISCGFSSSPQFLLHHSNITNHDSSVECQKGINSCWKSWVIVLQCLTQPHSGLPHLLSQSHLPHSTMTINDSSVESQKGIKSILYWSIWLNSLLMLT